MNLNGNSSFLVVSLTDYATVESINKRMLVTKNDLTNSGIIILTYIHNLIVYKSFPSFQKLYLFFKG